MVIAISPLAHLPVLLVVGDIKSWTRKGRSLPDVAGFHFAGIQDLSVDYLETLGPDVILSALMGERFDALDVARRLVELGFKGRYRAIAGALPNPLAIRAEVRAIAPDLDFDLFIIDGPSTTIG
jgi:hypothetical protein